MKECSTCKHFDREKYGGIGHLDSIGKCRRHSPRPLLQSVYSQFDGSGFGAGWPEVKKDDWCGDYEEFELTESRFWEKLDTPLKDLSRKMKAFENGGFLTLRDLLSVDESELMKVKGVGIATLVRLQKMIHRTLPKELVGQIREKLMEDKS